MSKHTLSGTDLSNGKRVNETFDINEEKKDFKFKTLKEYADYEGIPIEQAALKLRNEFGIDTSTFKGVVPTVEKADSFLDKVKSGYGLNIANFITPPFAIPFRKDASKFVELEVDEKTGRLVAKNRPTGFAGGLASAIDSTLLNLTDFDKRGGGLFFTSPVSMEGFGKLPEDYVIPTSTQKDLQTKLENVTKSPTESIAEANTAIVENRKVLDELDKKKRRQQAVETLVTNTASIPVYTRLLEDAAKRRLELDKAMLGAREMMPSNIQNIMLSKQAQQQMASSAFAEEAKALAAQQDAATKFAGLGMQRRFGQA